MTLSLTEYFYFYRKKITDTYIQHIYFSVTMPLSIIRVCSVHVQKRNHQFQYGCERGRTMRSNLN